MTDVDCPICGEAVEEFDSVGVVSIRLEPCGHQVDDRVDEDLEDEMP